MKLADRVVLVTGSSRGIGAAIAIAAAREGADVIVNYHAHRDEAQRVADHIASLGRRSLCVGADAGKRRDVLRLVTEGIERLGRIDVLVNNCGIAIWKPFLDIPEEDWDRTIETNLKSVYLCSQAVARALVARQAGGSIVNVSSIAAHGALDCLVPYCASKGGMTLITKAMATELAPHRIRVNAIAPGTIDIPRNRETDPDYPADWLPFIPLGRVGTVEDVASCAVFLASDEAGYVTGQTIWVDGGVTSYVPMPRADFAR